MEIQKDLCEWYRYHHRKLIFRENREPYYIWISEIMAQQTRIDSMLAYFERFVARFPTVADLAEANIEEVLKLWEGLGYYNRARKLQAGAKIVHEQYHDQLPADYDELLKIPGIGPYTAGAIASIAYDLPYPAVDGNVMRVTCRLLRLDDDIRKVKTQKMIGEIVKEWMKGAEPHIFTQAMMELGALVCTPKNPNCKGCPLNHLCLAHHYGDESAYPYKSASKPPVLLEYYTYMIVKDDKILMVVDDGDGLMKGFYRLPQFSEMMYRGELVGEAKHVFSHRIWQMKVMRSDVNIDGIWFTKEQLAKISIVTAHRKLIEKYWR